MRATAALGLGLALSVLPVRSARAQPTGSATLAVYLPGAALTSSEQKSRVVSELAAALGRGLGIRVAGRLYANHADFERALPDAAFVLSESAITATSGLRPVAVGVVDGQTSTQLALFALPRPRAAERRLVHPRFGKATSGILDSLLFGGETVDPHVKRSPVPDVLSGVQLLKLGKADYLLGYASALDAIRAELPEVTVLLRSSRVPCVTLSLGRAAASSIAASGVVSALAGVAVPQLGIQAFRPASPSDYESLARALGGSRKRTLLFAEPPLPWRPPRLTDSPLLPALPVPPLESYYEVPKDPPPLLPRR